MSEYISPLLFQSEIDKLKKENLLFLQIIEHGFDALNHAQDVINNVNMLDSTIKHNYKMRYFMQKYRCSRNRFVRMKKDHDFLETADKRLKFNSNNQISKPNISMDESTLNNPTATEQIKELAANQRNYFEPKPGFVDRVICKPCKAFFGRSYKDKFILMSKERSLKLHIEMTAHKLAVQEYQGQLKKRNKPIRTKPGKMELLEDNEIPRWIDTEIEILTSRPVEQMEEYINPFSELISNEELPDLSDDIAIMEWLITKGEPDLTHTGVWSMETPPSTKNETT
jgi:hypothetical protein